MANYYDDNRREQEPHRSILGLIIDSVLMFVTILVGVAISMTYLAPNINPGLCWIFSLLGLAAPVIYMLTLLLTLYWIIRWRKNVAIIMLLLATIGLFKVPLFYKPEFKRVYQVVTPGERGMIKFMTYNVRNFYGDDGQSCATQVMSLVKDVNPDILCMQEFNLPLAEEEKLFVALREKYHFVSIGHDDELRWDQMAIMSKYPILRWGRTIEHVPNLDTDGSIWADLKINNDTVRIFNNHLHSTAINASDNEFITKHQYISDSARETKIRSIVRRFRDNSVLRAAEVDSIVLQLAASPYPRIVCGDFNDTPTSYVYRVMAEDLNDAFSECGAGYSYTFRGFFNTLRIDYVLSTDDFETQTYDVHDVNFSDHLPVVVRLRYNPRY